MGLARVRPRSAVPEPRPCAAAVPGLPAQQPYPSSSPTRPTSRPTRSTRATRTPGASRAGRSPGAAACCQATPNRTLHRQDRRVRSGRDPDDRAPRCRRASGHGNPHHPGPDPVRRAGRHSGDHVPAAGGRRASADRQRVLPAAGRRGTAAVGGRLRGPGGGDVRRSRAAAGIRDRRRHDDRRKPGPGADGDGGRVPAVAGLPGAELRGPAGRAARRHDALRRARTDDHLHVDGRQCVRHEHGVPAGSGPGGCDDAEGA